jgi:pilus assembly protein CpaC
MNRDSMICIEKRGSAMTRDRSHLGWAKWLLAMTLGLLAAFGPRPALPADPAGVRTEQPQLVHGGDLVVPLNKSQILRVDTPFKELLVGNAAVADVMALTDQSIYVLGKTMGTTNLTLYGPKKSLIAVIDLVVTFDVEGLKAKLYEIMPTEQVEVRGLSGAVALSGTVSNAVQLARAADLAERYAPGKVSNHLQVNGSQQVMLEVRFAEVERKLAKSLSLNTGVTFNDGAGRNPGRPSNVTAPVGTIFGALAGAAAFAPGRYWDINAIFNAEETKGAVKTLAEPTLMALSGETATFLAGGEYPYPVPQSDGTITIEYKQFGVGLAFTPTVLKDGLVNLIVAPEVSDLDFTNAVLVGAYKVPALTTRRAKTTVELRDGQSFAIAGMLQNNYSDSIKQVPWLGDVPVLGALFRSPSFNRKETELVIVVTPRLAKPAKAGAMALPTDKFVPPSDVELFLLGDTGSSARGGGMSGSYGHSIK